MIESLFRRGTHVEAEHIRRQRAENVAPQSATLSFGARRSQPRSTASFLNWCAMRMRSWPSAT